MVQLKLQRWVYGKCLSDDWKRDSEIVMEAVKQDPGALGLLSFPTAGLVFSLGVAPRYAAYELRRDREFVAEVTAKIAIDINP